MPKVVPVVYEGQGRYGDFTWMILQPEHKQALFIFNDNEEHHRSNRAGAGNAAIRMYNQFSKYKPPRSAGIPTGTLQGGGYIKLTISHRETIDSAVREIDALIKEHKYETIYYSSRKDSDLLGTNIFKVGEDVIEYITKQILGLADVK